MAYKKKPKPKISAIPVLLKVRNIGASKHKSREFALTTFYIPGFNYDQRKVYIYIKCKLYLIEGLKANMLIGNNILYTKSFLINLLNFSIYI